MCLTIRLASVTADYNVLTDDTFELASKAYRESDSEHFAWMRAEAASVLGQATLRTDSRYARVLSEEALSYFESQEMYDMAANELFMDAMSWSIETERDSLENAAEQFQRSIEAGRRANNPLAEAYGEAGLCDVLGQLGRTEEALESCRSSLEQLEDLNHITNYSTAVNYASVLLADNRPTEALELLKPLPQDWPNWGSGYNGYRFYNVRGQVHAALGNQEQAIDDLKSALEKLRGYESNARARSNRLFQSRFRVEQLEQNLELRTREAEERDARNRIFFTAGFIVLVLLCIMIFTLVKHRLFYRSMAFTDPLTGASNRRYTEERAKDAFEHARARQQSLFIALIDLDKFKSCNDRYGHDAGDEALKRFVALADTVLRPGDLFGRWGGEEFLLVLQDIDKEGAVAVLERLRKAAAEEKLELAPDYPLQFSAGLAEMREETKRVDDLVSSADQALYKAKAEGRNRSYIADA